MASWPEAIAKTDRPTPCRRCGHAIQAGDHYTWSRPHGGPKAEQHYGQCPAWSDQPPIAYINVEGMQTK